MFQPGVTPQPLTSLQDIAAALSSGLAVQIDGGVQDVFNCPVVAMGQPVVSPGTTTTPPVTPSPPVYTPPSGGVMPPPY